MQKRRFWKIPATYWNRTPFLSKKEKNHLFPWSWPMDSAAPGEVFRFKGAFPAIVAYASCVQRSSVVLIIAFSMLSGYTVVTTNKKEHGSAAHLYAGSDGVQSSFLSQKPPLFRSICHAWYSSFAAGITSPHCFKDAPVAL